MSRALATRPAAAAGGCTRAAQKVTFHTPFLLFMQRLWHLWSVEWCPLKELIEQILSPQVLRYQPKVMR